MKDKDEEDQRENIGGDRDVSNRIGIARARWAEATLPESRLARATTSGRPRPAHDG